jgi:hypothetical protein
MNNMHKDYEQCLILFVSHKYNECVQKAKEIIASGSCHQSICQMLLISLQRLNRIDDLIVTSQKLLDDTISVPWLNSILKLTLGQIDTKELLPIADTPGKLCDVLYYTGARLKTLGLEEDANVKFKECIKISVESIEMVLARMELS